MRSRNHPIEIVRRDGLASARAGRPRLTGFWNPEHDVPSEPKLIVGDREKFERDLAAYKKRQRNVLTGSATRWWVECHAH